IQVAPADPFGSFSANGFEGETLDVNFLRALQGDAIQIGLARPADSFRIGDGELASVDSDFVDSADGLAAGNILLSYSDAPLIIAQDSELTFFVAKDPSVEEAARLNIQQGSIENQGGAFNLLGRGNAVITAFIDYFRGSSGDLAAPFRAEITSGPQTDSALENQIRITAGESGIDLGAGDHELLLGAPGDNSAGLGISLRGDVAAGPGSLTLATSTDDQNIFVSAGLTLDGTALDFSTAGVRSPIRFSGAVAGNTSSTNITTTANNSSILLSQSSQFPAPDGAAFDIDLGGGPVTLSTNGQLGGIRIPARVQFGADTTIQTDGSFSSISFEGFEQDSLGEVPGFFAFLGDATIQTLQDNSSITLDGGASFDGSQAVFMTSDVGGAITFNADLVFNSTSFAVNTLENDSAINLAGTVSGGLTNAAFSSQGANSGIRMEGATETGVPPANGIELDFQTAPVSITTLGASSPIEIFGAATFGAGSTLQTNGDNSSIELAGDIIDQETDERDAGMFGFAGDAIIRTLGALSDIALNGEFSFGGTGTSVEANGDDSDIRLIGSYNFSAEGDNAINLTANSGELNVFGLINTNSGASINLFGDNGVGLSATGSHQIGASNATIASNGAVSVASNIVAPNGTVRFDAPTLTYELIETSEPAIVLGNTGVVEFIVDLISLGRDQLIEGGEQAFIRPRSLDTLQIGGSNPNALVLDGDLSQFTSGTGAFTLNLGRARGTGADGIINTADDIAATSPAARAANVIFAGDFDAGENVSVAIAASSSVRISGLLEAQDFEFDAPVFVDGNASIDASRDIDFAGSINPVGTTSSSGGPNNLSIIAGQSVAFAEAMIGSAESGATLLSDLSIQAGGIDLGDAAIFVDGTLSVVSTLNPIFGSGVFESRNGDVSFSAVDVTGATALTAMSGEISIGSVNAADGSTNAILTINGGTIDLLNGVGQTNALNALVLTGDSATLGAVTTVLGQDYSELDAVSFQGDVTSIDGDITVNGAFDLVGDRTFQATNGDIAIIGAPASSVSSSLDLVANSVTLDGAGGGVFNLDALSITANTTNIANIVSTGSQDYSDVDNLNIFGEFVTTGEGTEIRFGELLIVGDTSVSAANGSVFFTGPVNSAVGIDEPTLAIAAGTINLTGGIGQTSPLSALTLTGDNATLGGITTTLGQDYSNVDSVEFLGDLTSLEGDINLSGEFELTGSRTFRAENGEISIVGAPADSAGASLMLISNSVTLNGAGGGVFNLDALSITANTTNIANIVSTGSQDYSDVDNLSISGEFTATGDDSEIRFGNVLVANATDVRAVNGIVVFGGNVNAASGADNSSLMVTSQLTSFNGPIGDNNPLSSLALSGGAANIVDVTTTGNQTYTGLSEGLQINGDLSGDTISLADFIFGGQRTLAAGTINLSGAASSAGSTGSLTFNASVILQSNATIDANAGAVTFGGTVDAASSGASGLEVTANEATFAAAVGDTAPLSFLRVTATTISATDVTTTGDQIFTGNLATASDYRTNGGRFDVTGDLTLSDVTLIDTTSSGGSGGDVSVGGAVGGETPQDLVISSGGNVTFGGGGSTNTLDVTAPGLISIAAGDNDTPFSTIGTQTFTGIPVTAGGPITTALRVRFASEAGINIVSIPPDANGDPRAVILFGTQTNDGEGQSFTVENEGDAFRIDPAINIQETDESIAVIELSDNNRFRVQATTGTIDALPDEAEAAAVSAVQATVTDFSSVVGVASIGPIGETSSDPRQIVIVGSRDATIVDPFRLRFNLITRPDDEEEVYEDVPYELEGFWRRFLENRSRGGSSSSRTAPIQFASNAIIVAEGDIDVDMVGDFGAPMEEPEAMSGTLGGDAGDVTVLSRGQTRRLLDEARRIRIIRGDTLWWLAEQIYGDGFDYQVIFGANRQRINNPNLIYPGQVFDAPTKP
ncbi:MAG: hypothetical protein AAGH38_00005, partial [Pseudomonadota bacterium]